MVAKYYQYWPTNYVTEKYDTITTDTTTSNLFSSDALG